MSIKSMDKVERQRRLSFHALNSPLFVAGVALLGYLLIFFIFLNHLGDVRDFVVIGKPFITQSDRSSIIHPDPDYDYDKNGVGYDGQFAYFIALDPINARYYLDQGFVSYRYTRILYPIAARALALGNRDWVPATMVMVNLLAITGGAWAVAAWCRRRALSPWLALVYVFYVGQVMGFVRSLNEPLAYALVALSIYLFERFPRYRLWAALVFALAALARESTLIFPLLYALHLFFESAPGLTFTRRLRKGILFLAVSIIPAAVWQVWLLSWLGSAGWGQGAGLFRIPLSGLLDLYPLGPSTLEVVEVVIVPGLLCFCVAASALWRDPLVRRRAELWALLFNYLLLVTLLYPDPLIELYGAGRISIPVVLAAIYSLALVRSRWWFYCCGGLWLVSTISYLLNPISELLHHL
ncbi:MAG TPA: hypothetical protein VJ183_12095 [Chloroflexia bacterium]|nr:hypothetical protein [Chloroflexia bacterium]